MFSGSSAEVVGQRVVLAISAIQWVGDELILEFLCSAIGCKFRVRGKGRPHPIRLISATTETNGKRARGAFPLSILPFGLSCGLDGIFRQNHRMFAGSAGAIPKDRERSFPCLCRQAQSAASPPQPLAKPRQSVSIVSARFLAEPPKRSVNSIPGSTGMQNRRIGPEHDAERVTTQIGWVIVWRMQLSRR